MCLTGYACGSLDVCHVLTFLIAQSDGYLEFVP